MLNRGIFGYLHKIDFCHLPIPASGGSWSISGRRKDGRLPSHLIHPAGVPANGTKRASVYAFRAPGRDGSIAPKADVGRGDTQLAGSTHCLAAPADGRAGWGTDIEAVFAANDAMQYPRRLGSLRAGPRPKFAGRTADRIRCRGQRAPGAR
jgi:hypothetical protein